MGPVRVRSRRGEGDRLREEILTAVAELLDETQDESAVSIRAIAERVGVTPPSIYRHFTDKDAMLSAVCEVVFLDLQTAIAAAIDGASTPFDALTRAGRCYIEFGLAHPEHYRLVFMRQPLYSMTMGKDKTRDEFLAQLASGKYTVEDDAFSGEAIAGTEAFGAFQDLVALALAEIPDDRRPDAYTMTTTLWMAVHGITSLRITKPDFPWPSLDEQLALLFWPWPQALTDPRSVG